MGGKKQMNCENQCDLTRMRRPSDEVDRRRVLDLSDWVPCSVSATCFQLIIQLFFLIIFILFWSVADLQCCVSAVQQSESVTHIHISILFQILSSHR